MVPASSAIEHMRFDSAAYPAQDRFVRYAQFNGLPTTIAASSPDCRMQVDRRRLDRSVARACRTVHRRPGRGPWPGVGSPVLQPFADFLVSLCRRAFDRARPVIQILLETGFTSESHFGRHFRKVYGVHLHLHRTRGSDGPRRGEQDGRLIHWLAESQ